MDTTAFPPSLYHCLVAKPQLAEKLKSVGWVSYFKSEMNNNKKKNLLLMFICIDIDQTSTGDMYKFHTVIGKIASKIKS